MNNVSIYKETATKDKRYIIARSDDGAYDLKSCDGITYVYIATVVVGVE